MYLTDSILHGKNEILPRLDFPLDQQRKENQENKKRLLTKRSWLIGISNKKKRQQNIYTF